MAPTHPNSDPRRPLVATNRPASALPIARLALAVQPPCFIVPRCARALPRVHLASPTLLTVLALGWINLPAGEALDPDAGVAPELPSYPSSRTVRRGSGVHVALVEPMLHTTLHYTWELLPKVCGKIILLMEG